MDNKNQKILNDIDEVHLASLQHYSSASLYIQDKNYQILSIRFLNVGPEGLENHTISFLIYKNEFFSIDQSLNLTELQNKYESVYTKILNHFVYTQNIMLNYESDIDKMEDQLFDRDISRNFMHKWFRLKKDVSKIQRVTSRSTLVLGEFNLVNDNKYGDLHIEFKDLHERFSIIDRNASARLNKLDNMYSYYNSLKSDGVNRSIYILSLISGLFLPLNLIVGFFGMNTQNLFLSNDSSGTEKVFLSLVLIACILIFFVPVVSFLDRILLRRIFGSAKHYERLMEKLKKKGSLK